MVSKHRRVPSPKQLAKPDLRRSRLDKVLAPDDQRDGLPHVVDHHREAVGPVPLAIPDGQVARRRRIVPARADQDVIPPFRPVAQRDAKRQCTVVDEIAHSAGARAATSLPAVAMARRPCRERRPGAVAWVHQPVVPKPIERSHVWRGVGPLSNGACIRLEPQPLEILQDRDVVLGPGAFAVVILDPKEDSASGGRRETPDPDRVGDVAEMEVPSRRRGKPCPAADRIHGFSRRRRAPARRDRVPRAPAWRSSTAGRAPGRRPVAGDPGSPS